MEAIPIMIIIFVVVLWLICRTHSKKDASAYDSSYRQNTNISNVRHVYKGCCPHCGSTSIQALNQEVKIRRGVFYQFFMGVLFILTFGILWLLLIFFRRKVTQTYIVCLNCGFKGLI